MNGCCADFIVVPGVITIRRSALIVMEHGAPNIWRLVYKTTEGKRHRVMLTRHQAALVERQLLGESIKD